MSKRQYIDGPIDALFQDITSLSPAFKIYIWNPNRCTLQDVVLEKAESPRYDISDWVVQGSLSENMVFESGDNASASGFSFEVVRDLDAEPIPISERTLLDGTPMRLYFGDTRVKEKDWILMFTGYLKGTPTYVETGRRSRGVETMQLTAVDRAEKYMTKVITARAYERGTDIGRVCVETAIEFMRLDRREIEIGFQDYALAHSFNQIVDVEVLKGIHQALQTVLKKPRFSSEGKLVAADTDMERPPVRIYSDNKRIIAIEKTPGRGMVNSFRLLGLDKNVTRIIEQKKRLAFSTLSTGFFEMSPEFWVYFSDDQGTETGQQGRIALHDPIAGGSHVLELDANMPLGLKYINEWVAGSDFAKITDVKLEADGVSASAVKIRFRTPFNFLLFTGTAVWWFFQTWAAYHARLEENNWRRCRDGSFDDLPEGIDLDAMCSLVDNPMVPVGGTPESMVILYRDIVNEAQHTADGLQMIMTAAMMTLSSIDWEIKGRPVANVYQQLSATAQLASVKTEDIMEQQLQNDWFHDIVYMNIVAQHFLKRYMCMSWTYKITMIDDPLLEVDDIIEADNKKFYVTSINRLIGRPVGSTVQITAWRLS